MVEQKVIVQRSGVPLGFFTILGFLFLTLKLCGVINWSWWLVLLPWYGPIALVLGLLGALAVIGVGVLLSVFVCAVIVEIAKQGKGG